MYIRSTIIIANSSFIKKCEIFYKDYIMIFKGSFRMNGFENTHKYLWQYNKQNDSSGTYLYHVIRPLFKNKL